MSRSRDGGRSGSGEGRDASAPQDIPPRGWWQIAKGTVAKFSENELMSEAASVTFFALLSLVPAVTALVSIYGLFSDPSTIEHQLASLSDVIPSGGMSIISEQVHRLASSPKTGLSVGAAVGVLTAIWSANQASKALFSALNDVYEERETRGFFRLTATSLAFTAGVIAMLLVGVALVVVLPLLFQHFGLGGVLDLAGRILRIPAMAIVVVVMLALLYRYGPSRPPPQWRWVTWGGALAAVGWLALSIGFSWYVAHFGSYNKTYGSLGAIIGFMTWIWLSSTVVLLGAQIDAEMERHTSVDTRAA